MGLGRGGCAVEAALRPEGARWVRASEVRRAYGLTSAADDEGAVSDMLGRRH